MFSDRALQTMAVAGNSVAYLDRLGIQTSTSSSPAIVFSTDRAMISSSDYRQASSVTMLDLTTPSQPKPLNAFSMPGTTSQLILTSGGILGPGSVAVSQGGDMYRSLQKLTLFSKDAGNELDNLLIGTEYNAFSSSWLDASDDQRIRLGAGGQRLFLPYSGRHHADQYAPTAHRLNITRVDGGRLVSERSFDVSDDVIRTAPIDENHSVVFSNSAAYYVDKTSGDWVMSTLREFFTPFATYRLDDQDRFARIARVGTKCRITLHAGEGRIFADEALAQADVPCGENSLPIGFRSNLLFAETRTGVRIDAGQIVPLDAGEVEPMLKEAQRPDRGYCYIDDGQNQRGVVQFLDAVPPRIVCENPKL